MFRGHASSCGAAAKKLWYSLVAHSAAKPSIKGSLAHGGADIERADFLLRSLNAPRHTLVGPRLCHNAVSLKLTLWGNVELWREMTLLWDECNHFY